LIRAELMQSNCGLGGSVIWFLLRLAFWLSLIITLLPITPPQQKSTSQVAATDALAAVSRGHRCALLSSLDSNESFEIRARYLVGCDGAHDRIQPEFHYFGPAFTAEEQTGIAPAQNRVNL
jgi:hypothetical protein